MKIQYVLTDNEVSRAKGKLKQLRWIALMNRDAGDTAGSREFYLKAKGFEDALMTLGILEEKEDQ